MSFSGHSLSDKSHKLHQILHYFILPTFFSNFLSIKFVSKTSYYLLESVSELENYGTYCLNLRTITSENIIPLYYKLGNFIVILFISKFDS